jgi:hypothetical protein
MKKITSIVLMCAFVISGCAQKSENIQATYVSPMQYQSYSCKQLEMEISRVSRRVSEVTGQQDKQAGNDAVAMGVGLIVFWPALFFLIGDDKKEELARLKGEYEALEQAAIQKNCTVANSIKQQREEAAKAEANAQVPKKKNWNN